MNTFKIEIKWAILFVVVALLWMLLERIAGLHSTHIDKHQFYTNLFAVPAIAVYVFALLDKRKKTYGGVMSYKQSFISGLIITAIVTILNPLSQYIISMVITPDFFSNAIKYAVNEGKMSREEAEGYFNLKSYIMQGFIGTPILGIVTTAIVSLFVRRK
jgi:hypothetical protein